MRRSGSSVFTAWSVSPETDIKVAVTFTFPRRISGGTGKMNAAVRVRFLQAVHPVQALGLGEQRG
jgi:hypothetical protein